VRTNGILVLGCEPVNYICFNDPDQKVGSYFTRDTVGGDLIAEDALAVIAHLTVIGQDVRMTGGGGGVSCSGSLPPPLSGPPYGDFEDMIIGGNLTITGWQSCWLGFVRDVITNKVTFNKNVTADPDGNEMATNSIGGNLKCTGNNPSPQIGDSAGSLDNVFGHATTTGSEPGFFNKYSYQVRGTCKAATTMSQSAWFIHSTKLSHFDVCGLQTLLYKTYLE
jgi:hypothetical protein